MRPHILIPLLCFLLLPFAFEGCMRASNAPEKVASGPVPLTLERSLDPLPPPGGARFLGPEACRTCHQAQYDRWCGSRHSASLQTLVRRGEQNTSDCLRCHTTGFSEESGFSDPQATPHLAAVTCEACHGPGSLHVKERQQRGESGEYGNVRCPDCQVARICMVCHREPDFDAKSMLKALGCGSPDKTPETEDGAEQKP